MFKRCQPPYTPFLVKLPLDGAALRLYYSNTATRCLTNGENKMATTKEKNELVENLKGNKVLDFDQFIDKKGLELIQFKKQFKRDWNANHEKVEKQMDENIKRLNSLCEEWIEELYPDEKSSWKYNYDIQIVISKKQV